MKNFTTALGQIRKLLVYTKGDRFRYVVGLIINSLTMIRFSFIIGFPVKWVTDSLFAQDWEGLRRNLVVSGVILVANALISYAEGFFLDYSIIRTEGKMKRHLFARMLRLPGAYFDTNHSGNLMSRLTHDVELAKNAISFDLADVVNYLSLGVGTLVFIALLNPWLALFCTGLTILLSLVNSLFLKPIARLSKRIQVGVGNATERFSDILGGIPVIKMFNLADWAHAKYDSESRVILERGKGLSAVASVQDATNQFMNYVFSCGIIAVGALFLANGTISEGSLLALFRYSSVLIYAFVGIGDCLANLAGLLSAAERVFEITDHAAEPSGIATAPASSAGPPLTAAPVFELDSLEFSYPGGESVLRGITASVQPGENLAIVGRSGAGKSTLLKLLLRFYELPENSESLRFRGRPLSTYDLHQLRGACAYVPQTSYLFHGTVRDNIALGRSGADEKDILRAADRAHAHQFISALPDGYDTVVGEGAGGLSGGEAQRVALARAFLKGAPVLLLDEATSALDSESEDHIQQAQKELMRGRTVITVAHRLSTVEHADRILVLDDGKIAESGSHEELLAKDSLYARFHRSQFTG